MQITHEGTVLVGEVKPNEKKKKTSEQTSGLYWQLVRVITSLCDLRLRPVPIT